MVIAKRYRQRTFLVEVINIDLVRNKCRDLQPINRVSSRLRRQRGRWGFIFSFFKTAYRDLNYLFWVQQNRSISALVLLNEDKIHTDRHFWAQGTLERIITIAEHSTANISTTSILSLYMVQLRRWKGLWVKQTIPNRLIWRVATAGFPTSSLWADPLWGSPIFSSARLTLYYISLEFRF